MLKFDRSGFRSCIAIVFYSTLLAGCTGGPARIRPPQISAGGAASKAMETYDTDGDGYVAGKELEVAHALRAALSTLDTDSDGKVSKDEIVKRIESWQATGAAVCTISCYVTLDGKPLSQATIDFEPEEFLGDEVRAGIAYSDSFGAFSPTVLKENRSSPNMPFGMQLGFYTIRVSKKVNGKETVPANYNTKTILGQQIAADDPAFIRQKIVLALKSR